VRHRTTKNKAACKNAQTAYTSVKVQTELPISKPTMSGPGLQAMPPKATTRHTDILTHLCSMHKQSMHGQQCTHRKRQRLQPASTHMCASDATVRHTTQKQPILPVPYTLTTLRPSTDAACYLHDSRTYCVRVCELSDCCTVAQCLSRCNHC
jgi:hypothetical protein